MQKNKNRPGYKKTKVGWIPSEWTSCLGRDIAALITKGSSPNWQGFDYQSYGVLFVTSENVRDGFLDVSDPKFLPLAFNEKLKHSQLADGDILINIVGASIGRVCAYQDTGLPANVNQAVCVFRCRTNVCGGFVLAFLQTAVGRSRLLSSQVESARPNVSLTDVRQLPIPLPSLPEQKAIAEILECWDKAIRNYEKKIGKKRNIKKGLMQRLLAPPNAGQAGKQRLPGFPGKWKKVKFGDVFSFLKTYALSREQLTTDPSGGCDIYNIHYGDLHATYDGCVLDCAKEKRIPRIKNSPDCPSDAVFLKEGDLIIADASEDYEGVCACVELCNVGKMKITGGLHTFVARDTTMQTTNGYRGYILRERSFSSELKRIAAGVSVYSASKSNLAKITFYLPTIQEQAATVSILSAADAEITALERKLAALQAQKCFLLNNLVTGSLRLPEFAGGCEGGKERGARQASQGKRERGEAGLARTTRRMNERESI